MIRTLKAALVLVAAGLAAPPLASAAVITWLGNTSTSFNAGANWSGGTAPATGNTSIFNAGSTYQPSVTASISAGGLDFMTGGWNLGGTSVLTLTKAYGINCEAGSNTISVSTLQLAAGSNQTWTVASGAQLTISSTSIKNSGGATTLTKAGAGTLVLNSPIALGGDFFINDGTVQAGVNNVYTGPATISSGGTLDYYGFSNTIASASYMNLAGGTVKTGAGTLTLSYAGTVITSTNSATKGLISGKIALTGGNSQRTISVMDGAANVDLEINAVISSSNTLIGLIKTGSGVLKLSGANTYQGNTNVNGGTLLVDGSHLNSGAAANGYIVSDSTNAATLGGIGSFKLSTSASKLTVNNAGILAPGTIADGGTHTTGILTVDGLSQTTGQTVTMTNGSTFKVHLNGYAAGSDFDQLKLASSTGNVTINLGGSTLDAILGYKPTSTHSFIIIDNDGADAIVGTFNGLVEGAHFNLSYNSNNYDTIISYVGGTGNDVVLTVPEPASMAMLGLGGLLLLRRRKD